MTDKEFAAQKARVEKTFRKWYEPTGMGGWVVHHVWYRDGTAGEGYGGSTSARADASWEYCHVAFHWNLQNLATNNDVELDRIIRHEICHVLVNEMRMWGNSEMESEKHQEAIKHEERTVSCLAAVLKWVREAGQHDVVSAKKKKAK